MPRARVRKREREEREREEREREEREREEREREREAAGPLAMHSNIHRA